MFSYRPSQPVQAPAGGTIQVWFKGTALTLSPQDMALLLNCGAPGWRSACYQIGLLDVCDTCIRTGFQGRNLQITLKEYDEFHQVLQEAYLQLDG